MFGHVFIYQMKQLFRQKWSIGWNFCFPLVLATVFFFGFGNLIKEDPDVFKSVEVGYVNETSQENTPFEQLLDGLTEVDEDSDRDNPLLILHEMTADEAEEKLKAGEISGYYLETTGADSTGADSTEALAKSSAKVGTEAVTEVSTASTETEIKLKITENGIDATILSQVLKSYQNSESMVKRVMEEHPENIQTVMAELINDNQDFISQKVFNKNVAPFVNYFYALLAMASLFGSWMCTAMLQGMCANMSERGKRFECSPTNKMTAVFAGLLACTILQGLADTIVILYINYVLGIHFGGNLLVVIALSFLASAMGISCGALIAAICKSESLLIGVPIAFSMICSFFSGLMVGNIRAIVEQKCPFFNRINPAAVYVESIYRFCNYGADQKFWNSVIIMACMTLGCVVLSSLFLRRRSYGSL